MTERRARLHESAIIMLAMIREALASLATNRLRTALTMLGIVIGVSAVIMLLAVSAGYGVEVEKKLNALGGDLLFVHSEVGMSGIYSGTSANGTLTMADADAIRKVNGVLRVAPFVDTTARVTYQRNSWQTYVIGTFPAFLENRSWDVAQGVQFSDADVRSARAVALLGSSVAAKLFRQQPGVGNVVRIGGVPFRVVGILGGKGRTAAGDQDDLIVVPLRALQLRLLGGEKADHVRAIQVAVHSRAMLTRSIESIRTLLRARHRIDARRLDDFGVTDVTAASAALAAADRDRFLMLGAIGSISLIVGGIGIMNVLMVSIAERTREISLRKALGATAVSVLMQFLAESTVLALIGCIAGVVLGVCGAYLFGAVTGMTVVVTPQAIIVAVSVSTLVGLLSGWWPAQRAVRLEPTLALRQA
jgi:putative ABC transport system permease protein